VRSYTVEHRLQIERRAADHLQDIACRGLQLERLLEIVGARPQLAEQSDAADALRCAERIIAALDVWNSERKEQGEMPIAFGIGLNCGPAVIGDVGSEHSLSFTVIGDTVNTSSRLQGLTRSLDTPLAVAEAVVDAINAAPTPDAGRSAAPCRTERPGRARRPRQKRAGPRVDRHRSASSSRGYPRGLILIAQPGRTPCVAEPK
jgi:class 3 adenylate cyclase